MIDDELMDDVKIVSRSGSTDDGIVMLSLKLLEKEIRENYPSLYKQCWWHFNIAGNKYNNALRFIAANAKALGIEDKL